MPDAPQTAPPPFSGHPGAALAVAVTPDGEELLSAGADGGVRVWNRRSGELRATLPGHTGSVWAVAVTPDGEELLSAGADGTIRIWNRRRAVQVRGTHLGGVRLGRRLAAVRSDEPTREDQLDVTADVEMLAALAASKETTPPLAIALLCVWGAGKSSVMRQMEDEVARLADLSRNNPGQSSFAASVKQIRFNAWHYSDDHVWTGLIDHLFQSLATDDDATASKPEAMQERREKLKSELDKRLAERDRLTAEVQHVDASPEPSGTLRSLGLPLRVVGAISAWARQLACDLRRSWSLLLGWVVLIAALVAAAAAVRGVVAALPVGLVASILAILRLGRRAHQQLSGVADRARGPRGAPRRRQPRHRGPARGTREG